MGDPDVGRDRPELVAAKTEAPVRRWPVPIVPVRFLAQLHSDRGRIAAGNDNVGLAAALGDRLRSRRSIALPPRIHDGDE